MRFAVVSGDFRIVWKCVWLGKRITLAHGPAKNRIGPGFGPTRSDPSRSDPLWVDFWSVLGPFFVKMCSPPSVGSTFLKNNFKHFRSDFSLFCSQSNPQMTPKWFQSDLKVSQSRLSGEQNPSHPSVFFVNWLAWGGPKTNFDAKWPRPVRSKPV